MTAIPVRVFGDTFSKRLVIVTAENVVWQTNIETLDAGFRIFSTGPQRAVSVNCSPYSPRLLVESNSDNLANLHILETKDSRVRQLCQFERSEPVFSTAWLSDDVLSIVATNGIAETINVRDGTLRRQSGRGFALGWNDLERGGGVILQQVRRLCCLRRLSELGAVGTGDWPLPDEYAFHVVAVPSGYLWTGKSKREITFFDPVACSHVPRWQVPWDNETIWTMAYLRDRQALVVSTHGSLTTDGGGHICLLDVHRFGMLDHATAVTAQIPDEAVAGATLLVNSNGFWHTTPALYWQDCRFADCVATWAT